MPSRCPPPTDPHPGMDLRGADAPGPLAEFDSSRPEQEQITSSADGTRARRLHHRHRSSKLVLIGLIVLLLAGCIGPKTPGQPDLPPPARSVPGAPTLNGSTASPPSAADPTPPVPTRPSSPTGNPTGSPASSLAIPVDKVLLIIEENRSVADVTQHMPYFTDQSRRFGTATNYYANAHPSLPNYLLIAGGSTFGVTDDDEPAAHPLTGPSIFSQMLDAGRTTKTYAEAMPGACSLGNHRSYAVRHNPWTYFTDDTERSACSSFDQPLGSAADKGLAHDTAAGGLPNLSVVIPDICNDGHDCSAETADDWLRNWVPVIQDGPDFRTGRLAIIITWDEDDYTDANHIPFAVIHPSLHSTRISARFDHRALSASLSHLAGSAPLREARNAPDILTAFHLR